MPKATEITESREKARDLTFFQQNMLLILAEDSRYGLAVKRELEEFYGTEVNHGRLYTNLDDLTERGLVEVDSIDDRTNSYALTQLGRDTLLNILEWEITRMFGDRSLKEDVLSLVGDIE